jgi:hypothetical protein
MKKFVYALLLGIIAGIIDVVPMILQDLDWYANSSAFVEWIVIGIIISYIQIPPLKSWLKGFIIAEVCVLPIVIIVAQDGILEVMPIIIMSAILGSLIGFISHKYLA